MTHNGWPRGGRKSHAVRAAAYATTVGIFLSALLRILGTSPPLSPDRGDFYRVGGPAGIVVPTPDPSHPRRVTEYRLEPAPAWGRTTTSAAVIATLARGTRFLSGARAGFLDIRQVGFLHVVFGAVPLALALATGLPPILGLGFAWVMFDPVRLALCTSLLTEPPGLMGIAGVAVLLATPLRPRDEGSGTAKTVTLVAFVAMAALAGFSRAPLSLVPLSALAVAFFLWPSFRRNGLSELRNRPGRWALGAATALVPLAYFSTGDVPRFWTINAYHGVFLGIADVSSEPERVLENLGIPRSYGNRIGSSYFDQPVPKDLESSLARVSRFRIATAFAREPATIVRAGERLQLPLARERVPGESSDSRASAFSASNLHSRLFAAWPPLVWLAAIGSAAFCLRRKSLVRAPAAFLALSFVTQIAIAVLGDGFFALGRHLAPARLCLDLLCVTAFADGVSLLVARFTRGSSRPESHGASP